ncbi:MAG: hypothetical protein HRT51_15655 [Colwellia sp.]|nr:hypothetical protein [Colwellia sp.]
MVKQGELIDTIASPINFSVTPLSVKGLMVTAIYKKDQRDNQVGLLVIYEQL